MEQKQEQPDRRRAAALALAAVLAATTLTGGAAVLGLTRHANVPAPAAVHALAPTQAQSTLSSGWDD